MNAAVERIQHVARSRDAEHDISRCHDIQLQVLKCFKKILIWWCRLFSWEFTIKINNFEITDLHMLIHASVRTQENNFVSKLFSCGVQTSGHRKIIFMGGSSLEHICTSNPRKKMSHDYLRGYGSLHDFAKKVQTHMFSFTNQKSDFKRPRRRCQK